MNCVHPFENLLLVFYPSHLWPEQRVPVRPVFWRLWCRSSPQGDRVVSHVLSQLTWPGEEAKEIYQTLLLFRENHVST